MNSIDVLKFAAFASVKPSQFKATTAFLNGMDCSPPHQISSYLTPTDFKCIRDRNFWIPVDGTFET
jgi:hypothetical protein